MPFPKLGAIVPPVPNSPDPYKQNHPDRVKKFPLEGDKVVRKPSPDSVNRQGRHDLDHDAELVFWLLLYWVVGAQPAQRDKEDIISGIWTCLTGPVRLHTGLLRSLSEEESLEELAHSVYRPLLSYSATLPPSLSSTDIGLTTPKREITKIRPRSLSALDPPIHLGQPLRGIYDTTC